MSQPAIPQEAPSFSLVLGGPPLSTFSTVTFVRCCIGTTSPPYRRDRTDHPLPYSHSHRSSCSPRLSRKEIKPLLHDSQVAHRALSAGGNHKELLGIN